MVVGNLRAELKLINESVSLIREIIEESEFFWNNSISAIKINDSSRDILIETIHGQVIEYSFSEMSYILTDSREGLWEFGDSFYNNVEIVEKRKKDKVIELEKNKFIEYAGRIDYIKYRLDTVLDRLRLIEKNL